MKPSGDNPSWISLPRYGKASIRPGSVYYFPSENLHGSTEPHYFVVINVDPFSEDVILLVCASSSVARTLEINRNRSETVVVVEPTNYPILSHKSVFNCNDVFVHTIDDLAERLGNGTLNIMEEMDANIVEKLRQAAIRSPLVTRKIRNQLQANKQH